MGSRRGAWGRTTLLAGLAAALAGCNSPGGMGMSLDRYTYESTPWRPWTVNLIDTRTHETIWSAEVPPGKQLVVVFRRGKGPTPENPDLMTWEITDAGRLFGAQSNKLPVPPREARLLAPTLRPAPEFPVSASAEEVPPPPPLAPIVAPAEHERQPAETGEPAEQSSSKQRQEAEPPHTAR